MAMSKGATYLEELDRLRPFQIWMLARHSKGVPLSQQEIANRAGWPIKKVRRFCGLTTWAKVTVEDADAFRIACNVTRRSECYHFAYWRRTLDLKTVTTSFIHFRKRPSVATSRVFRIIKSLKKAA